MKRISKAAALLAVGALLVGGIFLSCSSDGLPPGSGGGVGDGDTDGDESDSGTSYAWNFQAEGLVTALAYDTSASGASLTATEAAKVSLSAAGTYESTPAGLTLNLPKGGYFNKVAPSGATSNSYTAIKDDISTGSIEPNGTTLLTVSVKGPFTATMYCGSNSAGNDKSDRYAFIKINGEEVAAPNKTANKLLGIGEKLTYKYEGTDTVTVGFGATSIIRIYDIKITTENGDATGKTAGEVKSLGAFTQDTDDSTANDVTTLGLVGTTVSSSAPTVATADLTSKTGYVTITSVGPGTATITVSDGTEGHNATIAVTVSALGEITIGTITKYTSAPKGTVTLFPSTETTYNETGVSSNTELISAVGKATFEWKNCYLGKSANTDAPTEASTTAVFTGFASGYPKITTFSNAAFSVGGTQNSNDNSKYDITGAYFKPEAVAKGTVGGVYCGGINVDVAVLTFTVTAAKNCTITTASGKLAQSQTGNMKAYIIVGSEDGVEVGSGKDMSFTEKTVNKTVTADTPVTIKVAVQTTSAFTKATSSAVSLDFVLADLVLNVVGEE